MSKLSFILPVFKPKLEILEKCVKSLCEQSLKDWDAIFVLDGPCDEARQIIARVMKKKANSYKIVEIEHGGAQRARNEGFRHSTGEYLCFFDSDCEIEVDSAQTWCNQLDKNQDIAFVYSGYRYMEEKGAIPSEPFNPFTLRVRNYVSSCFPVRRKFYPGWNETLKSLQDWDFWLSVVEKGGTGKFLKGYAFSTPYPEPGSISGEGCTWDKWLERIDAVKKIHSLPERDVCVSSLAMRHEGIALAKVIDADYQDFPTDKPHKYKTIIQLGFSFLPGNVEYHSRITGDKSAKHIIFYTCDDVTEIITRLNLEAVWKYSANLNGQVKQFVDDKAAYDLMKRAGFDVEILPIPMEVKPPTPLPDARRFAVDVNLNYNPVLNVLQRSLPDVELVPMSGAHDLNDFAGLVHLHPDRSISIGMKRAVLMGRPVVSNVQAPFMGYVNDTVGLDKFIPEIVNKIREVAYGRSCAGRDYYVKEASPERLKELCK